MSILSDDLETLSAEAYTYLYPLVTMEVSRRQQTSPRTADRPAFGPANRFHHLREFPSAGFRAVVRPNFDTLYSSAWLDLSGGPVLIDIPDSGDRYYMMPMLDMWTDVFASPGKRTTGTGPQRVIVLPPRHTTALPADLAASATAVVEAPTTHVWVIGRTQTNGPSDYPEVNAFQDGLAVTTLGDPSTTTADDDIDLDGEPLRIVNAMSAVEFFTVAAGILMVNRPHPTDFGVLSRIARLGIIPGEPFDASAFGTDDIAQIEQGAKVALARISDLSDIGVMSHGWEVVRRTIGVYGNEYLQRAQVTLVGLGANPANEAIYPLLVADADGDPLTGDRNYVLRFAADELPPVDAFWSVTMYDAEGYQVANDINRFAIGDRDPLHYNDDGSLDIWLQHTDPGRGRTENWLPTPANGPLGVTLRLYAPSPPALDGSWTPPPVHTQ